MILNGRSEKNYIITAIFGSQNRFTSSLINKRIIEKKQRSMAVNEYHWRRPINCRAELEETNIVIGNFCLWIYPFIVANSYHQYIRNTKAKKNLYDSQAKLCRSRSMFFHAMAVWSVLCLFITK